MNIEPFGNQILIEPIKKEQILVSDVGTLCEYGNVIAIGDQVEKIKVGDVIGYTVWGVNSLVIDDGSANGKKYYFIPEDQRFVLGKLNLPKRVSA